MPDKDSVLNARIVGECHWSTFHWNIQSLGLIVLAFLNFYPGAFHYHEYLFFVFFLTAVMVAIVQGSALWIRSPVDLPLAFLVGWILITIPFSLDPAYSFAEWRKLVAHCLVLYWTLLVLKHSVAPDYWRYVIWAMLVGVSTMTLYALVVFLQAGGTLVDRSVRAYAPASVVAWLGAYVVMMIALVIACYVWATHRWEKLALGGIGCLILAAEFLSYARAGWLALAVMMVGFGVLTGNRRTFVWGTLSVVVIASVLVQLSRLGYLGGVFDPGNVIDRVHCWSVGVHVLLDRPIVGMGFGQDIFGQLPDNLYGECIPFVREIGIHNTFLMYAMGSGMPAIIFLLWMFAVIIKHCSQDARDGRHTEAASVKLAVALAVLGYGVTMITDNLFSKELAYLFWMLVAIGFSLPCQEERPVHHMPDSP